MVATVAHVPNGLAMSVKVPTKWTSLEEAAHTFFNVWSRFFFFFKCKGSDFILEDSHFPW